MSVDQNETIFDYQKYDPVLRAIGELGRWQLKICFLLLMISFPFGWHQFAVSFLAPKVEFKCIKPNGTEKCSPKCQIIKYDRTIFKETIITEWDLICEYKILAKLTQEVYVAGQLIGNPIFGICSDKIGRRPTLQFSILMLLIFGVGAAFCPWFWLFCLMRFLTGIGMGGSLLISFVIIIEIVGPQKREIMTILQYLPISIGYIISCGISYLLSHWRLYLFTISIPTTIFITYYWLIPESPKWLLSNLQFDKAAEILENAAKYNKMPFEYIRRDIIYTSLHRRSLLNYQLVIEKAKFSDLFRYYNLRIKTILMCFNLFVAGLTFFGITRYIAVISDNLFRDIAICGLIGIFTTLISIPLTKYYGRKRPIIVTNTLAGITMLFIAITHDDNYLLIIKLSMFCFACLTISVPLTYLYWGELLPTTLRNTGLGLGSTFQRIGTMIIPVVTFAAEKIYFLPPIIFGILLLIGAILNCTLPETRGDILPELVDDSEKVQIINLMSQSFIEEHF